MAFSSDIQVAFLFDGEFVRQEVNNQAKREVEIIDVYAAVHGLYEDVYDTYSRGRHILPHRIYWYDALPRDEVYHPNEPDEYDPKQDPEIVKRKAFLDELSVQDFAIVRRGIAKVLGRRARRRKGLDSEVHGRPIFEQKQVDMMLGLDMAWLSLKKIVDAIVIVTGDTDFIEPIRMASKEGTHVFIAPLGGSLSQELANIVDGVLPLKASHLEELRMQTKKPLPRARYIQK